MIPDLLWRCPLCAVHDSLVHRQTWLRADVVACNACGARWRVRRAAGDDFYLKLTDQGAVPDHMDALPPVGEERRLSAWYDLMKQTLRLEALPSVHSSFALAEGEMPYLVSGAAELWADPPGDTSKGEAAQLDQGRLFLTNRRFVWRGDAQQLDFPLHQVNGVYAFINFNLALVVGQRLYQVLFARESLLKWVTHAALLAPQVQAESGHILRTSHY